MEHLNSTWRLKLPAGYAIETLPQQETINLGGALFTAHWWDKGTSISFHRSFTMSRWEVPVLNYPVIRTFYGKVAAADQQMVLLRKQ